MSPIHSALFAMISLSPTAIAEVQRLKGKHSRASTGALRISVQQKGCAGLSYHLDFAESAHAEDQCFEYGSSERGKVQILVSAESLPYLNNLTLDYSEDLMGGSFRFDNPNARQTCSCGHSFSMESAAT
jgi:iron-sulfur cluster assembly protein